MSLTQERANALFEYREGKLYWKVRPARCVHIGDEAGGANGDGYKRLSFKSDGVQFREMLHRVVFLMHHGYMPEFVDHIDGDPTNNSIENLRSATKSQNSMNKKRRCDNSSGVKNVYWFEPTKKWRVAVTANRKLVYQEYFSDKKLAELASIEARKKFHGEFACSRT